MIFNAVGGSGGGIEGMIESYRVMAGESVSVGDFIQYINRFDSMENVMLRDEYWSGYYISAVKLDGNRVFLAHSVESSPSRLYGMVLTIDGTTITATEDVQLYSEHFTGISAVGLDERRIFLATCLGSENMLYGMIVTVDGTTITPGIFTQLNNNSYSWRLERTLLLNDNRVFVAHGVGSGPSYVLYGLVVAIDGATLVPGTDTKLYSDTCSGFRFSIVNLDGSRVYIACSGGGGGMYYLDSIIVVIEDLVIIPSTVVRLVSDRYAGSSISAVKLDDNRVFIAHSRGESYSLYGLVATIDGTTITHGEDQYLSAASYVIFGLRALKLDTTRIFIACSAGLDQNMLVGVCVTVAENVVTREEAKSLSNVVDAGYTCDVLQLDDGRVFVAHSQGDRQWQLYYIMPYISGVRKAYRGETLLGVAKTGGTQGRDIEVYTPN